MIEQHLQVSKTARYFQIGAGTNLKQVWFVCHGYGHLASDFVRNFEVLLDGTNLVVAPEGLSRFYLNGFSGRVGATWMTKEDRLHEIEDYLGYLDAVSDRVCADLDRARIRINVLGFSQGAATAARWAAHGRVECDHLILWSGLLPPELVATPDTILRDMRVTLVVGNTDKLANEELISKQEVFLAENKFAYEVKRFAGGHELHDETLQELS